MLVVYEGHFERKRKNFNDFSLFIHFKAVEMWTASSWSKQPEKEVLKNIRN